MPGIVGMIDPRGARDGPAARRRLDAALRRLCHLPEHVRAAAPPSEGVLLGQVWRDGGAQGRDWAEDAESRLRVMVSGCAIESTPRPRRIGAAEILDAYRASGAVPAADYDGGFVVVVVDGVRRRLLVVNDRLGCLPLVYAADGGRVRFGPEVKAIAALDDRVPDFDRTGLVTFLSIGYCLGGRTLFEGVHHLCPGSVLEVDLDTGGARETPYWTLRFDPDPALARRRAAEDALYEALIEGASAAYADGADRYDLMLSGGLDSRGVLAVSHRVGRPPRRAFSWGVRDDIPYSDAWAARRLAESFGVPFAFHAYDTDAFPDVAADWVYVSELANDNVGWFAEGAPALASAYRTDAAFAATGDVVWDVGPFVEGDRAAIALVMPPDLPEPLRACLREGEVRACEERFHEEQRGILARCESLDPNDRKDFFYVYARAVRFIFSLGYFKEHAVEIRRPFLGGRVLDVYRRLPARFRVRKDVYTSLLRRRFPEAMRVPKQSVLSLPDWNHDVRRKPAVRDAFRRLLARERVEGGVLSDLLDAGAVARRVEAFFAAPVEPVARRRPGAARRLKSAAGALTRRHPWFERMARVLREPVSVLPRNDFDFVRCVALVTLLEEHVSRFRAD